jgi:hypothetical protein
VRPIAGDVPAATSAPTHHRRGDGLEIRDVRDQQAKIGYAEYSTHWPAPPKAAIVTGKGITGFI